MNRKTLISLALVSAFAISNSLVYAQDEKQEAPKPEFTAQSDESSTPAAPKPEFTAQSDESSAPSAPKPEFTAQSDEKPAQPAPELISA